MGEFVFEVALTEAGIYTVWIADVDWSLIVDDDGDGALRTMDRFIRAAQVAREQLVELISQ